MPLFENNLSPYLTIVEATEPAAPSAGQQRLYIDSTTHLLKATNSSGTDRTVEGAPAGPITTSGLTQATARLLGRSTASTGAIEEISVGTGLSLAAGSLTATGGSAGALVLLEQHTASSSATLDFTTFISSTYDNYLFECVQVAPANNGVDLDIQFGSGGGPTYDTGNNYYGAQNGWRSNNTASQFGVAAAAAITIAKGVTNAAGYGHVQCAFTLAGPQSTTIAKRLSGTCSYNDGTADVAATVSGLWLDTTNATTAIRFFYSTGNIASGIIRAYGITK